MRILFLLLMILAFSCRKSGTDDAVIPLHDSIQITSPAIFPLDLNRDGQDDITIHGSWTGWQNWQTSLFYISKLHNQVSVHTSNGQQPICEDSVQWGAQMVPRISNCNGAGQQVRIDHFVYTPNLGLPLAANTAVQEITTDTLLIHESYATYPMPGIYTPYYSWSHGFFSQNQEGYLLFSINQQRFALKLRYSLPFLYFDEIHRLD